MKKTSVFEFDDYKAYLGQIFPTQGEGRGKRSKLALALRCQTAFVSQVLNGHVHFSLEAAVQLNEFLGHSEAESHFFMLLVQQGRAGSPTLAAYFARQIGQVREKRQEVRERIQVQATLSHEGQMTYYSAWYYAAIHVMLSIPEFGDKEKIAHYLRLPLARVTEVLEFLAANGLATSDGARFRIGSARIHLGRESPMLAKHHVNWRTRVLQSIDQAKPEDLHYSSVLTLSAKDAPRIRSILLQALETCEPVVTASPEEGVYCMAVDFFGV